MEDNFTLMEGDDVTIIAFCDNAGGTLTVHSWGGSSTIRISRELYDLMKKELLGKL
jgi:hypothetical protein